MYGLECSNDYLRKLMRQESRERFLKEQAIEKEAAKFVKQYIKREKFNKTVLGKFFLFLKGVLNGR